MTAAPHPSQFIREELDARGWTLDTLAARMGGDFGINRIALDFYFEVGPDDPNLMPGADGSAQIGRAFGVSPFLIANLHTAWRRSLIAQVSP